MQSLYNNEKIPYLLWLMVLAGPVLIILALLDYSGVWPVFGGRQLVDLVAGGGGAVLESLGFFNLTRWVKAITVPADRKLTVVTGLGRANVSGEEVDRLHIQTRGRDDIHMTLAAGPRQWSFPMTGFAADRFAETIKAMNPNAKIERSA